MRRRGGSAVFRRIHTARATQSRTRRRGVLAGSILAAIAATLATLPALPAAATAPDPFPDFEARSLDGGGNNQQNPTFGQVGTNYIRVGQANYADGTSSQVGGPPPRYSSNRVFNDLTQNIFSERNLSQFAWSWGQFMDHVFGLAQGGGENSPIGFDSTDPLESFSNGFGSIPFRRDAAAPNTGTSRSNPRQAVNTLSSYIDAFNVYGGSNDWLEWLREGPVDGNMANNGPKLLLTSDSYLPRATARGNASTAPKMATDGQLAGHPQDRAVAGDVRANENMVLTDMHTLFAREHNRIVDALPATGLTDEQKFQIARRVVGAEQQFVTYNEFLPAMGVNLPSYAGYNPNVNSELSTEFATVGYRAHSQIHGEFEISAKADNYSDTTLDTLRQKRVEVTIEGPDVEFEVPLQVAFFDPDLVNLIGAGPILKGLTGEAQYKNDEQIDNALRSTLFEVPGPEVTDPDACFDDPTTPGCFQGVVDLGAIDIQRGRDHGVPTYNQMRQAYGLPAKTSFTAITGESTDQFPKDDPQITGNPTNDPNILDFVQLFDRDGNAVPIGADEGAVVGVRRSTLAARLKAIYGKVDNVEAFAGALSEPHVAGSEMGELNLAIWSKQYAALRDGDRFFYANDPVLTTIKQRYGITYQRTLGQLISLNTDVPAGQLPANVFFAP